MTEIDETVQAVRRFSRFYTAHIGTLEEGFLRARSSLPASAAAVRNCDIWPARGFGDCRAACASTLVTSAVCSPGWSSKGSFAGGFRRRMHGRA